MKTQKPSAPKSEDLKFGARLRKLSREYGWAAFGVYLTLSALDFPLCYLMVRFLGAEKIVFNLKPYPKNRCDRPSNATNPLRIERPLCLVQEIWLNSIQEHIFN
ncbi:hypothetical protein GcM1_234008 [Golovinomyces cichoracearum]|uniref:DUF1279 domain-containing protein n=1 Tax=Golovinomyces cichoracearum TaxID=62708 RepID=A0A420IL60_9PEZI|nr:hypothetical protein GcM1_234008 [Golovinomyces cichoracearum]